MDKREGGREGGRRRAAAALRNLGAKRALILTLESGGRRGRGRTDWGRRQTLQIASLLRTDRREREGDRREGVAHSAGRLTNPKKGYRRRNVTLA